jgi:serine/threonine-protein kinase
MSLPDADIVEALFWDIANLPCEERRQAMEDACGGDEELREELSSLIEAYQDGNSDAETVERGVPNTVWFQEHLHRLTHRVTEAEHGESIRIGRTFAHFRVIERIGRGGMGVVYLGQDMNLGRSVALKFLTPHLSTSVTAKKRFVQEAKAASSLNHRNICTIHEIGETEDGQLFIAMAYYEGETLRERLDRGDLPSVEEAVDIGAQVAEGLARAHRRGIMHRDIKPGNIMLGEDGGVIILDFGLAKLVGSSPLTSTGHTLGTAAYMSPEQLRGERVGEATDVWSLGVLLYEMLAGERPFAGEYVQALIYKVLNEDPRPLNQYPGISEELATIVAGCLNKDVADRFASAVDVREAFDTIRRGRGAGEVLPPWLYRAAIWLRQVRRRHRKVWVGATTTMAILAVVLLVRFCIIPPHAELLAVLPLEVIGAEDRGPRAAGLQEAVASKLSQLDLPGVKFGVIPVSEISGPLSASEARRLLGATLTIQGRIEFEAGRNRLFLNLVDTKTLRLIDSRMYDDDETTSFAIQDHAVTMVVSMLEIELDPEARRRIARSSSPNREANSLYLDARGYLREAQSVEDVDGAISLFDLALAEDPDFSSALAGLADAYWEKYIRTRDVQWAERAIDASSDALLLDSQSLPVYLTLGKIYSGQGIYDEAIKVLDRAAGIDRRSAEIYLQRGFVRFNQKQVDEAEEDFKTALTLAPGHWRTHQYRGSFFYRTGQYERAAAAWQWGLDIAPGNADLLANLGAAQWALARPEQALDAFETALKSDPEHARARSNLGTLYFYLNRLDDAARFYEAKLSIAPKDRLAASYLADTYYLMPSERHRAPGLYRLALKQATKQLGIQPNDPEILADAAYYYAALQRPDSAAILLSTAIDGLSPDSSDVGLVFAIGETYERMGRRDEAVGWMAAALERDFNRIRLRHSPFLADIRKDARLSRYLRE